MSVRVPHYIEEVPVHAQIGKGSHSLVYSGTYRGKTVAVKFSTTQNVEKLTTEASILQKIQHPNIVRLIGLTNTVHNGVREPGLVLELLENHRQLSTLVGMNQLTEANKLTISQDICRAVIYLHTIGVFHRSLHARNIMISATFRAVITDFGNAEIKSGRSSNEMVYRNQLGTLLHQIYKDTVDTQKVEDQIGGMRLQDHDDSPIKHARDICWTRGYTQGEFRKQICVALGMPLRVADSLEKPLHAYTADELYALARTHEQDENQLNDNELASEYFLEAAKRGHAEAQYSVGLKHSQRGNGFFVYDMVQALVWLHKALEQGHENAEKKIESIKKTHSFAYARYQAKKFQTPIAAAAAFCESEQEIRTASGEKAKS